MDWTTELDTRLGQLGGHAAQVLVAAIHDYRGMELRLIGTATLPDGAQLVDLEHADGRRVMATALTYQPIRSAAKGSTSRIEPSGPSHSSSCRPQ